MKALKYFFGTVSVASLFAALGTIGKMDCDHIDPLTGLGVTLGFVAIFAASAVLAGACRRCRDDA